MTDANHSGVTITNCVSELTYTYIALQLINAYNYSVSKINERGASIVAQCDGLSPEMATLFV